MCLEIFALILKDCRGFVEQAGICVDTEGMSGEVLGVQVFCFFLMNSRFGYLAGKAVLGSSKIDSEDCFVLRLFDLGTGGDDFKTGKPVFDCGT